MRELLVDVIRRQKRLSARGKKHGRGISKYEEEVE